MHVSPVNFKALACVLDVEGFDSHAALGRCGVAPVDALDDHGPWLPLSLFDAWMAAVVDVSGDPCFGLVAGRSKALMRYATLMQVTLVAPSLRQVIADIARFAPLFLDVSELQLDEGDGVARLVVNPVVDNGLSGHFRAEMVAMSALLLLRFARGGDDIHAVEFPYPGSPERTVRYAAAFGVPVHFDRPACAIVFAPQLLDAPLPTGDPVAHAAARAAAESALTARGASSTVGDRVRHGLLAALPHLPTVDETAGRLHTCARALRRQLAACGLTHEGLQQQCQREVAEQLLADPSVALRDVADRVGFASVASFHRAFRRWHGVTPSAWRADHRADRR